MGSGIDGKKGRGGEGERVDGESGSGERGFE